jgi:hypothetical protein
MLPGHFKTYGDLDFAYIDVDYAAMCVSGVDIQCWLKRNNFLAATVWAW